MEVKHAHRLISMVMLLLFIFVIGGRAVVSLADCHCVEDIISGDHHNCCACDDHIDDCSFHTQSVDSNCTSHIVGGELTNAIIIESKSASVNRAILLFCTVQSVILETDKSTENLDFREHDITLRLLDWICDVGLLRAPPVC